MHIYRSRILNPISKDAFVEYRDGALRVDEDGRVAFIGDWGDLSEEQKYGVREIDEFHNRIIIPGLVDAHLHLSQFDTMGIYAKDLLRWLNEYIFLTENRFKDAEYAHDVAKRFFRKVLSNGTTLAGVYSSIHHGATDIAFEEAANAGIKVILGKVMMNQNSPEYLSEETETSIRQSIELCEKWNGYDEWRFHYAFTPRFAVSCSFDLMKEVGRLARSHDAYIQTHLSENKEEVKLIGRLYPDHASYTDVYNQAGILTPKTIMAHAIHLEEEEYKILADSGTKVAHCPDSNFFLKSGRMDIYKMDEHNIPYALGSDIGAGTTLSMMRIMKMMDYMQARVHVNPTKLFYHATLGGAEAFGMGDRTGNLETGKDADFLVLDPANVDASFRIAEHTAQEILSFLVYQGGERAVKNTYIRGRKVFEYRSRQDPQPNGIEPENGVDA